MQLVGIKYIQYCGLVFVRKLVQISERTAVIPNETFCHLPRILKKNWNILCPLGYDHSFPILFSTSITSHPRTQMTYGVRYCLYHKINHIQTLHTLQDFRISQQSSWRFKSSGTLWCVAERVAPNICNDHGGFTLKSISFTIQHPTMLFFRATSVPKGPLTTPPVWSPISPATCLPCPKILPPLFTSLILLVPLHP